MKTEMTVSAWRRVVACVLTMLVASAPLMADAGQNGRRAGSPTGTIRAILDFDADWTLEFPQVNWQVRVPTVCRTAPYVAGPNEVAIVNIDGFISTNTTQGVNIFELDLAISENGGPFSVVTPLSTLVIFAQGLAQGGLNKRIALTEGVSYLFGAGFSTYAPVTNSYSVCRGVVTIAQIG